MTKATATHAINTERAAIEAIDSEAMPLSETRTQVARLVHAATRLLQSARTARNCGQIDRALIFVAQASRLRIRAMELKAQ